MTCGLFDLACHAQVAVGGLFDWLLGFFDARTLVMLWIGTAIGAKFGWPALIAETFGLLALFGRRSNSRTDGDGLTVAEKKATVHRPAKRSAKRPTLRDIFKRRGE